MTILANKYEDSEEDGRWLSLHQRFVSEARESEPEVLWLGDFAIQHLVNADIWNRRFCQMHSLNFGIEGDRTENLLWRLQNGELEGLSPKVIVLMIGTNNHGDSAEQIADGIKTICALIRDKQPQAYLVVMTLLPRGHNHNPLRERNAEVNRLIAEQLKGNSRAQFVNSDSGLVQPDGTISHHDMFDYFHPTQKGYEKVFDPVYDLLLQLLSESEGGTERTEAEGCAD
uniref:Platelet-activating factor acetylhydrolase IB subunit gamma n=1 Tax=Lepeophtheirus salmonis TaxID=72036 RepID=D3PI43_LEPSM|nr:Platelet-activating factor acetylhydrolase IB subunit gamma [Lepeophtheirus salmonis]